MPNYADHFATETLAPSKDERTTRKAIDRLTSRKAQLRQREALRRKEARLTPPKPRKAIAKKNDAKRERRRAKFKARLSRADWKKLRLQCFERDGFRCTQETTVEVEGKHTLTVRCWNADPSRKGRGLVADHLTYARFGNENLEDLRTLCAFCNRVETQAKRANHAGGFSR